MNKLKNHIPLIINTAIIISGIIVCCMNFRYGWTVLRYYTLLSNIFALATSTMYVSFYLITKGKVPAFIDFLRYAATVCLTITFMVVMFIFVPMSGSFKVVFEGVNFFQHFLCPLLSIVSFIFFEKRKTIKKGYVFLSLIPTFTYATVIIILNIMKKVEGPYPFLMVYKQSIPVSVMWFFIINGIALLTAAFLRVLGIALKSGNGEKNEN